jgi:hypothetical protein
MLAKLIEFYRYTLGPDLAGIVEGAVKQERNRILGIIEAESSGDCCWQYHSGHIAKSSVIEQIKGAN